MQADVERQMLLLNDIPGVTARAAFTPGASTGTADMVVSVAEDEPLELRGELNNHGSKSTGIYRAGFTVQLRDVFGWGDTTTARALASNKGSLVNGSLATSVPFGGDGFKVGANLSRLKYQLAGDFKRLGAVGSADVLGFDASYPFRRTTSSNVAVKAGFEQRRLSDELQLLGTVNKKRNNVGELTVNADLRDDWGGASAANATASMGQLTTHDLSTDWRKLLAQAARQQAITGPWSLYGRVTTQYTGGNLDSSDKMGLGGPGAVRAYAAGEASVDLGTLASLEVRYAQDLLGGGVVLSLFHDQATGRISRSPIVEAGNRVRLSGSGLGASWNGGGIGLNATLAWRGSRVPTADGNDPQPRLFLQMSFTP
jgi:hemolysin activation/secretion protein